MLRKIFMKVRTQGRKMNTYIYLFDMNPDHFFFLFCDERTERLLCGKRIKKIRFIFILHVLWLSNEDQYRQLYE